MACCTDNFTFTFTLPEGQKDESWEPSRQQRIEIALTFENKHERQILTDCQIYVTSQTEVRAVGIEQQSRALLLSRNSVYSPSIIFQLLQIAFLGRCDPHCDAPNTTEGTVSSLPSLGLCYYIARQRNANKSTEGLK